MKPMIPTESELCRECVANKGPALCDALVRRWRKSLCKVDCYVPRNGCLVVKDEDEEAHREVLPVV